MLGPHDYERLSGRQNTPIVHSHSLSAMSSGKVSSADTQCNFVVKLLAIERKLHVVCLHKLNLHLIGRNDAK